MPAVRGVPVQQHLSPWASHSTAWQCGNQGMKTPQLAKTPITQSKEGNPQVLMLWRFTIHSPGQRYRANSRFPDYAWRSWLSVNPLRSPHFPPLEATRMKNAHLFLPAHGLKHPFTHPFNSLCWNSGELFAGVKLCRWLSALLMTILNNTRNMGGMFVFSAGFSHNNMQWNLQKHYQTHHEAFSNSGALTPEKMFNVLVWKHLQRKLWNLFNCQGRQYTSAMPSWQQSSMRSNPGPSENQISSLKLECKQVFLRLLFPDPSIFPSSQNSWDCFFVQKGRYPSEVCNPINLSFIWPCQNPSWFGSKMRLGNEHRRAIAEPFVFKEQVANKMKCVSTERRRG